MKLLVLTSGVEAYGPVHYKKSAEARRMGVEVADYSELVIRFEEKMSAASANADWQIDDFDMYVLRGVGAKRTEFYNQRGILAEYLQNNKKKVLNGSFLTMYCGGASKLRQHFVLTKAGVAMVPTKVYGRKKIIKKLEGKFPLILKPDNSSKGRGISLINTQEELVGELKGKRARNYLVQEFMEGGSDFRVLVLGGKVLGVIRRVAPKDGFLTNVWSGGKAEKVEGEVEVEKQALEVAKIMGLEFAGVDIVYDKKQSVYRVYEVNDAPAFEGFESVWDIDVAGECVDYLVNKGTK